jgi:hypothetical protein
MSSIHLKPTSKRQARALRRAERVLQGLHRIGQGVWELHTYSIEWLVDTIAQPFQPVDADERLAVNALMPLMDDLLMGKHDGTLCLLCSATFATARLPAKFLILRPGCDALTAAGGAADGVAGLLCPKCSALPDWQARVLEFYRKNAIQDLRPVMVAPGGHA